MGVRVVLALTLAWAVRCAEDGAPRPLCPPAPAHCRPGAGGQNEYMYSVDNENLLIEYIDGKDFVLTCAGNVTLDSPSLPRFRSARRLSVPHVKLVRCAAPARSYDAALGALGLAVVDKLTLVGPLRLSRERLAGAERVATLVLEAASLADDALDALPRLAALRLVGTPVPASLPPALARLQLVRAGAPSALALRRAVGLESLVVREDRAVTLDASGAPALRELALESNASAVDARLPASLRELALYEWAPERPEPWAACAELRRLRVFGGAARALPPRWVAPCRRLEELELHELPHLAALADAALAEARALRNLTIVRCGLESLPQGFLDDLESLERLNLSYNELKTLPNTMFVGPRRLEALTLSHNRLPAAALYQLSGERLEASLRELRLDDNPLGDSCPGGELVVRGASPLQRLARLRLLSLRRTRATLLCRDWRQQLVALAALDLRDNAFTRLKHEDLMFFGAEPLEVRLEGNEVTGLRYSRCDYVAVGETADGSGGTSRATFRLDGRAKLACDCEDYWAARALRERPEHVRVLGARCAGGEELSAASLDSFLCDVPVERARAAGAPDACRAAWQPRARSPSGCRSGERAGAPGATLVLDCDGAALTSLPRLGPDYAWNVSAKHNLISRLEPDDLPADLLTLDLRNNSVSSLDARALSALRSGRVLLSGNPLDCGCSAVASLAALRAHRAAVADYDALACADGASPDVAPACAPRVWPYALGVAGALLALASALSAAAAWNARARSRLKRLLRLAGWAGGTRAPAHRWDAFLSHSHRDEAVAAALLARLEGEAPRYRVCHHARDWAPGAPIPAQIEASVRGARVTLALVSAHFERSTWACAEFRAALRQSAAGGAARLVAVLLCEPRELSDAALRRFLAATTYVVWGEPLFWDKLRRALGPPRAAPVAPAAPLAPSTALAATSTRAPLASDTPAATDSGVSDSFVSASGPSTPLFEGGEPLKRPTGAPPGANEVILAVNVQ